MTDTITVTFGGLSVEVARVNGYQMTKRYLDRTRAAEENQRDDDEVRRLMRLGLVDYTVATIRHEGFDQWPLDLDTFMSLDGAFQDAWGMAVYERNPVFLGESDAAVEKKA